MGNEEKRTSQASSPQRRRARDLVEKALSVENPIRRMDLVRKAIEADDSIADAWGILAEEEPDPGKSAALFAKAYARAEATLGAEGAAAVRNEGQGDPAIAVWDDPAGLSYLRSRAGLGLRLALLAGREDEATGHMLGVLRLDPDDELGVCHYALPFLLERNDEEGDGSARHVMLTHPCDCVHHCYWDVLLSFRQYGGEDERTIRALAEAIGSGPVVPPFLYGEIEVPPDIPPVAEIERAAGGLGPEERAVVLSSAVASELLPSWEKTPEAGEWLGEKWRDLAGRSAGLLEDPSAVTEALSVGESPESLLASMLAAAGDGREVWEKGEAGFLYWREREEEDVALSRFRDGLEGLIRDRAQKAGLSLERGTAPFPGIPGLSGSAFGDLPDVSPLTYLAATGRAGKVGNLAEALLEAGVSDFAVFAEDAAVIEAFAGMGVEVFEGPAGNITGD